METSQVKVHEVARLYAALGHSLRLQAVMFLASQPFRGAYVSDIVAYLQRAQSTVSHHLKVLVEAGVLEAEPHGNWGWYQIVPTWLTQVHEHLSMFGTTTPAFPSGVVS